MIPSTWIDGAPVTTAGARHDVINPATGDRVAELALATPADVDVAVASARAALPEWSTATPGARSAVLFKLAELVEDHAAAIVAEEVSQTGKPVRLATEFEHIERSLGKPVAQTLGGGPNTSFGQNNVFRVAAYYFF